MTLQAILICCSIPFISGILAVILFGKNIKSSKPTGLLFHSVLPGAISPNLSCISAKKFSNAMNLLKQKGYESITIQNFFLNDLESNTNKLLITFDDGFQNVYDYALPALENIGFKASIFCVTDFIGKSSTWDVYGGSVHLSKLSIRTLSDLGHEIGSHTSSHAYLPFLSEKDLYEELYKSKAILEDIIGKPVKSLSFPYGGWTEQIWDTAQNIGYHYATTYRNHDYKKFPTLLPVYGVYQFDSPSTIIKKIKTDSSYSIETAIVSIMPHFAKGTPIWKFRKNYQIPAN